MSLSIQSLRLTSSINSSRKPFLIRLVPVLDNYPLLTPSTPLHLLALWIIVMIEAKFSHVTMGQRTHAVSRSWKHQGTTRLEPPKRNTALLPP